MWDVIMCFRVNISLFYIVSVTGLLLLLLVVVLLGCYPSVKC